MRIFQYIGMLFGRIGIIALLILQLSCSSTRTVFLRYEPTPKTLKEQEAKPLTTESKIVVAAITLSPDRKSLVLPVLEVSSSAYLRTFQMKTRKVYDSFCDPGYRFDENCQKSYSRVFFWDWILGPASLWLIPYFSGEEKKSEAFVYKPEKKPLSFKLKESAAVTSKETFLKADVIPTLTICQENTFLNAIDNFRVDREKPYGYDIVRDLLKKDYQLVNSDIDSMDYFLFIDSIKDPIVGTGNLGMHSGNHTKFKIKEDAVIANITTRILTGNIAPMVVQRLWEGPAEEIVAPAPPAEGEEPAEEAPKKKVTEDEDAAQAEAETMAIEEKPRPTFAQSTRFPFFSDLQKQNISLCTPANIEQVDVWIKKFNDTAPDFGYKTISRKDFEIPMETFKKEDNRYHRLDLKKLIPFLKRMKSDILIDYGKMGRFKITPKAFQ